MVQFDREASQTRDYCVAKNATQRAARMGPSLRKKRLFRMTIKLIHYPSAGGRNPVTVTEITRGCDFVRITVATLLL